MQYLTVVFTVLLGLSCSPDTSQKEAIPGPAISTTKKPASGTQADAGTQAESAPKPELPLFIDKNRFTRFGYLDLPGDLGDPVNDLVTFDFDERGLIESAKSEYFNELDSNGLTASSLVARSYLQGRYRYAFLDSMDMDSWILDLDTEKGEAIMTRDNGTATRFHVEYTATGADVFFDDSDRWMMHFERDAFAYRYGYAVLDADGKTQHEGESRYDFTRTDGVIRAVRTSTGEPEPTEIYFSKLKEDSRLFVNDMGGISRMGFRVTPCSTKVTDPLILALNMEISEALKANASIYFMPYLPGFWDPPN